MLARVHVRAARVRAIAVQAAREDDMPMSDPPAPPSKRRHNPWIWVSGVLALVAVGLLIWALSSRSDLDSTQQQLDSTQKQLDSTKQDVEELQSSQADAQQKTERRTVLTAGATAAVKAVYDDLSKQLGATQEDLAGTQQDLEAANQQATQAEKDAAAAKDKAAKADNETDKAKAEAEQAQAEADAAQSRATVAKDCAKAYVSALGGLFEGESVSDQAPAVRDDLASITADCQAALGES